MTKRCEQTLHYRLTYIAHLLCARLGEKRFSSCLHFSSLSLGRMAANSASSPVQSAELMRQSFRQCLIFELFPVFFHSILPKHSAFRVTCFYPGRAPLKALEAAPCPPQSCCQTTAKRLPKVFSPVSLAQATCPAQTLRILQCLRCRVVLGKVFADGLCRALDVGASS